MTEKFDVSQFASTANELKQKMKKMQEEIQEASRKAFKDATDKFFEATPAVEGLIWVQYTPYFNDGDECVFSVHDVGGWLVGTDIDDIDPYDSSIEYELQDTPSKENIIGAIAQIEQAIEVGNAEYGSITSRCFEYSWTRSVSDRHVFKKHLAEKELERLKSLLTLADLPGFENTLDNFLAIKDLIETLDYDTMKSMFGDHVQVRVTREGVETSEFDHD